MIRVLYYPGGPYAETGIGGGLLAMWQTARAIAKINSLELNIICEGNNTHTELAEIANFVGIPEGRITVIDARQLDAQGIALLEGSDFDVLHCMLPVMQKVIEKASSIGVKVVYEVRHPTLFPMYPLDFIRQGSLKYLRYSKKLYADRYCANIADIAVAPSEWARRQMVERYRIPRNQTRAFYNGVVNRATDTILTGKANKKNDAVTRLISIGRLEHGKGFDVLLKVFKDVINLRPDVNLEIVGGGTLKNDIQEMVENLGLASAVRLAGVLTPNEVCDCYQRSDIYISCSENESFGNVIAEAMSASVPVVAWAVGAIPEVVGDAENAVLVPYKDLETMAAEVVALIDDAPKRESIAKNAKKFADDSFSWEKRAASLHKVYHDLSKV